MKLKLNSMGSPAGGQSLYIKIYGGTHGIRVHELEEYCKYEFNGNLTVFTFEEDKYKYVSAIRLSNAFDDIPEVKEFINVYYKEAYDKIIEDVEENQDDKPTLKIKD